jgi:short-subunit dehydrogenase
MRQHRSGTIVNISSVVGRVVFPGMGVYSATKFAVEALSDALRMELAPFGVSVVLIEPAFVKTDLGATSVREAAPFTLAANGYQELMEKTGTFLAREIGENAIPAEKVARQIADAVESRKPKARYALPLSGRAVIKLFGALPPASADRAKLRRLGVGRASS